MKSAGRPIVVNAPSFNETSGGAIVLHCLVDRLRRLGREAYVHPLPRRKKPPPWPRLAPRERWRAWRLNRTWRRVAEENFVTHPALDVPRAPPGIMKEAVAVYPEIVPGDPLRSRRVVRWLLHKPGFFDPDVRFGRNELTFFYQHPFREGLADVDPDNLLQVRWIRDDVYFDRGLPRAGACRLVRKGARTGMAAIPENDDAVLVDALSHEGKAEAFNRAKVLYSHDPYTMYLFYAALCGCVPVVLPQPGMSREQWRAREEDRWGVAYGEEEIPWAVETRGLMLDRFARAQEAETETVVRFLEKVDARFP